MEMNHADALESLRKGELTDEVILTLESVAHKISKRYDGEN